MSARPFVPDAALSSSRRQFVTLAGIVAAAGVLGGSSVRTSAQALTDFDILNFALNLEYLEAEYYLRAAFGRGLADAHITGTGTLGGVTGGSRVRFATKAIKEYATEIARDEEAHVKFIRAAITAFGGQPVARPTIDLQQSFTTAAGYIGPKYQVDHDVSLLIPEVWCRLSEEERDPDHLLREGCFENGDLGADVIELGERILAVAGGLGDL